MFADLAPVPKIDCDALVACLRREGTPKRVHYMELFLDAEVKTALVQRFGLDEGLPKDDPFYQWKREIRLQRFLGYDYVYGVAGVGFPRTTDMQIDDTSQTEANRGRRSWVSEGTGPIASWQDFEKYPWPDPAKMDLSAAEWLEKNLPHDMCMTAPCHSVFEQLSWLIGLEHLAFVLYDEPKLAKAVADRAGEIYLAVARTLVQFSRIKFLFGGDDMGHRTATLVSPEHLRRLTLPWHKKIAGVAHDAGKLYLLHSCGNLEQIMPDLCDDVKIDARHSYEDTIERVESVKRRWGHKVAVIGGIDVDFLCRSDEKAVRKRVRATLDACVPGGGYCLGTGNSMCNYIPLDSYLVMLDEGRRYANS
jgi:uroporphyrinogen decarboxylase